MEIRLVVIVSSVGRKERMRIRMSCGRSLMFVPVVAVEVAVEVAVAVAVEVASGFSSILLFSRF